MRSLLVILLCVIGVASQTPALETGVSHTLAKWRAEHYSDIRYKLNLTLEKMSPVLKGTIEIRVRIEGEKGSGGEGEQKAETRPVGSVPPIILDWRKIAGHEKDSTISNVTVNGTPMDVRGGGAFEITDAKPYIIEDRDHLIIGGARAGENVVKLDFTSPILTSGSAITRYVDKEDGAEYIYSLFVPSDASTAFPVFDQPDLKARFELILALPTSWQVVSNTRPIPFAAIDYVDIPGTIQPERRKSLLCPETKPISTYVFAFAAGPWERMSEPPAVAGGLTQSTSNSTKPKTVSLSLRSSNSDLQPPATAGGSDMNVYVRKSQAAKFKPHAAEVFHLTREGIKFLETYFDYKFPFPKYDLVLIPEFPFGGMEHAGATFLRESSVIFPTEPTKNDQISRANLIFHETAHQWFGDTVTMKWFDDLWLKEGFAEFMAYKTLEKVMPEANAWKVFYERNKQAAYQTDSTRGTTPIYQEITNLSAAKSAYGNIVYRKAPSFLRQAEFYLGEDKFQTAVRAFLKKHEFANAGWEDLVKEFEAASEQDLKLWAKQWVTQSGLPVYRLKLTKETKQNFETEIEGRDIFNENRVWRQKLKALMVDSFSTEPWWFIVGGNDGTMKRAGPGVALSHGELKFLLYFPNYQDYGYGIFLLDDKSRDYVLKNIQNEKDPFLRTMMWGSLWDSVREAELDPKDYVELVVKMLGSDVRSSDFSRPSTAKMPAKAGTPNPETDEGTIQTLLGRVATAMNYYYIEPKAAGDLMQKPDREGGRNTQRSAYALANAPASATDNLRARLESLLIDRIQNAPTAGQRITFYRAFLGLASSERARGVLKQILKNGSAADSKFPLKTKDRFDIVTRLIILGDADAPKLLVDLEKTETGDDAKRYAYAAKAGAATAENKAKYWNDFLTNKDISESWIEAAMVPFNSIRQTQLTQQFLERALAELPNLKRSRKIFFVNGWLGAFIGGQRSEAALAVVNKFLADNPNLDNDLRLKILENVDTIERAVKIRNKYK